MHEHAMRRLEPTGDLHDGVERAKFEIRYRPIVGVGSGRLAAVEALVRPNHPGHGLLAPGEFIELAEETGLIVPIGRPVLREACMQLARWHARFGAAAGELAVSVNVSVTQLDAEELVADVWEALTVAALLILEITESVLMGGDGIHRKLMRLHELGVRVAVEDFGTGYSSLGYLRRHPFDILKIDRSFIDGRGASEANDELVAGIISLAHCLELDTVAEGVERHEQAAALERMPAPMVQGYHWPPGRSRADRRSARGRAPD